MFDWPKICLGFICVQVKGYRYLEEDNSDESESEEEEDKDEEEHVEHWEEKELENGEGPGAGDEGGQEPRHNQGADSPAPSRGAAEVYRRRRDGTGGKEGEEEGS